MRRPFLKSRVFKALLLVLLLALHFAPGVPAFLLFFSDVIVAIWLIRSFSRKFFYRISRKLAFSYFLIGLVPVLASLMVAAVAVQIGGSLFLQHQFASTLQQVRLEWDKIAFSRAEEPAVSFFNEYKRIFPGMKMWCYTGPAPVTLGLDPDTPPPAEDVWMGGGYHMVVNIPDHMTVAIPFEEIMRMPEFAESGVEAVMGVGRETIEGISAESAGPLFKPSTGGVWSKPWILSFYVFSSSPSNQKAMAYLRTSPKAIYATLVSAQPLYGQIWRILFMVAFGIIFLLGGTAIGYATWIIVRTTRGISRVSAGVKRFSEGDMEFRIRHKGHDELAQLATSFNRMAESLKSYIDDEVSRAEEKKELELAMNLQNRLFPEAQTLRSLGEVSIHFNPSKMVGGDYYDYIYHNGLDYVLIGDASGHGLAASLVMAMAKTAISSLLTKENRPEEVLPEAHEILKHAGMADQYVTLQLACIDRRATSFRIFNAGHPPAYHISGGVVRSLRLDSFPMGIFDGPSRECLTVRFKPGDLLFLCTDGLYEVYAGDEQYGPERLEDILRKAPADPHLAVEAVLADVESFKGANPFEDDLTIICIKLTAAK
jgi:serine phosphatase RsbU (regulator of sigma subunit)